LFRVRHKLLNCSRSSTDTLVCARRNRNQAEPYASFSAERVDWLKNGTEFNDLEDNTDRSVCATKERIDLR
jgi:hypothetical protein